MSTAAETEASIKLYKEQIAQVDEALRLCDATAAEERESLESLKRDLLELLSLTQETLQPNGNHKSDVVDLTQDDPFEDEMALFMSEIKSCDKDQQNVSSSDDTSIPKASYTVGSKCNAPHTHTWNAVSYHNALVCAIEEDGTKARILFTNPTHREMLPCNYYLDGDCRFDAVKCQFSHGELIDIDSLKPYCEPNFELLNRPNCSLLVKQNDRLWYKSRLVGANFDTKQCRVRLEATRKQVDCDFEEVFPLEVDDTSSSDDTSDEESLRHDAEAMQQGFLIEQSLLNPAPNQALGEWEQYTRGIGSKIMQKMGYIVGTSLGTTNEGIIVPIAAQILPPGRSLDHCMQLRDAANGATDLFSVERKMKRTRRKKKQVNARHKKGKSLPKKREDLFDFINTQVLTKPDATNSAKSTAAATTVGQVNKDFENTLKNETMKTLNVAALKYAEEIRRKETDLAKLEESLRRQGAGTAAHTKFTKQMSERRVELSRLKDAERTVAAQQKRKRDTIEMTVF